MMFVGGRLAYLIAVLLAGCCVMAFDDRDRNWDMGDYWGHAEDHDHDEHGEDVDVLVVDSSTSFDASRCGVEVGCLFSPPNCQPFSSCDAAFNWRVTDDEWIEIELIGKKVTGVNISYVAVGFSRDQQMGSDQVIDCTLMENDTRIVAHLSHNTPYKTNEGRVEEERGRLDLIVEKVAFIDGHIYCKLKRRLFPDFEHPSDTPLAGSPHYILLATGEANENRLFKHAEYPFISDEAYNFSSPDSLGKGIASEGLSLAAKTRLKKAHGILMMVSWFILITNAVLVARYFKLHWQHHQPCGIQMWFHVHRMGNSLAVTMNIVAFICIFVAEEWLWRGPAFGGANNDPSGAAHSMIGLIAVLFSWVQPIGAIFRCDRSDSKRYIFTWGHRFTGITAWLLAACACILKAVTSSHFADNTASLALMVVYLIFVVITVITNELMVWLENQTAIRAVGDTVELAHRQVINGVDVDEMIIDKIPTPNKEFQALRTKLLVMFNVAALLIVGVLIILVAAS